ncbi:MAG: sigma 54-interacting transcriptional regulator [Candidatus Eisenbacteria bacterium]|uniref:Sigma 54-interacting transcriptional regulator n=1 Tax=Eiseniibacteriota bacterium TaxID=2212470 RepID=A0A7Y2ECD4_UNCEI|nr:sigma 54-interacting transcriptional regulator [Candidatus Eisenbacteria bacterium]
MSLNDPPQDPLDRLKGITPKLEREAAELEAGSSQDTKRLIEGLETSKENLQRLLQFVEETKHADNHQVVLEKILDCALDIVKADRACILRLDGKNQLDVVASRVSSDRESLIETDSLAISQSTLEDVLSGGQQVFVEHASEDEAFRNKNSVAELNLEVIVCIPLGRHEHVQGALYVDSRTAASRLDQAEGRGMLEALASQAEVALHRLEERERLIFQNESLRELVAEEVQFENMVGRSDPMQALFKEMKRFIARNVHITIRGETGTGKELVARAFHYHGARKDQPFLTYNCGNQSNDLLQSELFGHAKGAFTGADQDRPGLFEAANGGTLFLDEIGEISQDLQTRLLRVLESGEVRRLGETKVRNVDVRILSASHKSLEELVAKKEMREDFYYRISVITVKVPPLRERGEDILLLADHFLEKNRSEGERPYVLTTEAKRALLSNPWKGNVRELNNVLSRAVAVADSNLITPQDLAIRPTTDLPSAHFQTGKLKEYLLQVEKQCIEQSLSENSHVVTKTAQQLGMSRQNLHARMKALGISKAK